MRIGIDLGGTNLAYGLVDDQGAIVKRGNYPLQSYQTEYIVDLMLSIYNEYVADYEVEQIGIGVPGIVSQRDGVVITCVNLGWKQVPLMAQLSKKISCPITIGNDANAACVAETRFGSMRGYSDTVLLTLGTGVGSGLIAGGKLLTGRHGAGAEYGHVIVSEQGALCNCGNRGCLETFASATAIIRQYNTLYGDKVVADAKTVFDRYLEGDQNAIDTINWFSKYLAVGIVNLYNIFSPDVVALGGGVSKAFDIFAPLVRREIEQRIFCHDIAYGELVRAELDDAGIIGAAFLSDF